MVLITGAEIVAAANGANPPSDIHRSVKVRTFLLDRLEVSAGNYLDCRASHNCTAPLESSTGCNAAGKLPRLEHPMNCITWHEAHAYCKAKGKRLPTSPEWELAARGTDGRHYPWGNELPKEQVCLQGRKHKKSARTCPVGSYPKGASPFGALDMAGNVAEWTTTVIEGAYPAPIYDTRGGSYAGDEMETEPDGSELRSGNTGGHNPSVPDPEIGFRCARDLRP